MVKADNTCLGFVLLCFFIIDEGFFMKSNLSSPFKPKNLKELIGQDIMVETITNSIKLNKLPKAY